MPISTPWSKRLSPYASKLLLAGVDVTAVRIRATIHDFVMLNALDQTNACRAAMDLAVSWLERK